ncbi:MAG: hypothetical protein IIA99_06025, partial [Proteobacteria bacterium]|nr:hypothetical protein [Pseudomonadota bacterium]
ALLFSLSIGAASFGGGDTSGLFSLAEKRLGKDDKFDLKKIAGQAILQGVALPGLSLEETKKAAGALPPRQPKTTLSDITLETERRLAKDPLTFLQGINPFPGGRSEQSVRNEVFTRKLVSRLFFSTYCTQHGISALSIANCLLSITYPALLITNIMSFFIVFLNK